MAGERGRETRVETYPLSPELAAAIEAVKTSAVRKTRKVQGELAARIYNLLAEMDFSPEMTMTDLYKAVLGQAIDDALDSMDPDDQLEFTTNLLQFFADYREKAAQHSLM